MSAFRMIACLFFMGFGLNAAALVNPDFEAEAGFWTDRDGPPGWELRLGDDDQIGIVDAIDFAYSGQHSFYFSHVHTGFGGSRLEQCVTLGDEQALMLSAHVLTDEPHPELSARLRMDFYADEFCDEDSANADAEQVQTDIGLSADRAPAGQWVRLESETRLRSQLGADVGSVQVSLRLRDRSDDGAPRDPARIVWFDAISLQADVAFIPEHQRQALMELYQATGGGQWTYQLGWMGSAGTECDWQGVTCNPGRDAVTSLDLARNGLSGALPESMSQLDTLLIGEGLDLCWNDISMPETMAGFIRQHHLGGDLAACQNQPLLRLHDRMGGHFFQPADRNGEGIMLHMLSQGSALFFWASYDDHGNPVWLTGSGRARDRVIHFQDIYQTRQGPGATQNERVGRASLAFLDTGQVNDCSQAMLRFHASGEHFEANDDRQLIYIDGMSGCQRPTGQDPVLADLEGHWFDPARDDQGVSLAPIGSELLLANWYTYDKDGGQIWRMGVGQRNGNVIDFGTLLSFSGGSFNDYLQPHMLDPREQGHAKLFNFAGQWIFLHLDPKEEISAWFLRRLEAGPMLRASSGSKLLLSMSDEDLDLLYSRHPASDERLPGQARFSLDDEPQSLMGLRFRGSSSRYLPKKAFNIRFEQPQPLLFGSDRMNLNAMYTDPAMMREALAFELFEKLGQPASRTRHFDFWINGVYEGLHIHIQRVDEWLLSMNGLNPDGTLVRDQFRDNSDLASSAFGHDYAGLDQEARLDLLAENFDYRGDPDWTSLLTLIEWVRATPTGPAFADGFIDRIELDNFIDWLALHWLIGDIDSFGDDYWLYLDHDDADARWHFIPWDKDLTFGSHFRTDFGTANDFFTYRHDMASGWQNTLISKFLATPELRAQLDQRLLDLLSEHFPIDWFHARIDELAERIEDSVNIEPGDAAFHLHDQNHHGELGRFDDHVEALKDFIELRYQYITRQLAGETGPAYSAQQSALVGDSEKLFITDTRGVVLASLEPADEFENSFEISVQIDQNTSIRGIDREWTLTVDHSTGPLTLTLHYENDLHHIRPNWWTEGMEPVGEQDRLVMISQQPNGETVEHPTRINPYSNKALAEMNLNPGQYLFWLVLPED